MQIPKDSTEFQKAWFELAEKICQRIYEHPEVKEMKQNFTEGKRLTAQEKSDFISLLNKVKYEVLHEEFGENGTETFEQFRTAWKAWFNSKEGTSEQLNGRRLTNAEHIVYSSTPDPENFLANFK